MNKILSLEGGILKRIWVTATLLSFATAFSASAEPFLPLPKKASFPKENVYSAEKLELGKQLFFDPRLSKDGTLSCNSCHNVMAGGADARRVSSGVGAKLGGRNAPTVWNSAFLSVQFWDGRAANLEDQAKGPLVNPVEMAMDSHPFVVERLRKVPGYVEAFGKIFGENAITIDNAAAAIATYERTLITPNSPFDKFLNGNKRAISAAAQRGYKLVQDVGCIACHQGVIMAGPAMPIGSGFYQKFPLFAENDYVKKYDFLTDLGRYQFTKRDEDKHMFRVPTWRNIALTAPYFHNGSVSTLQEAVRVMAKTQLNRDLKDEETGDIVEFLNSLTGEFPKQSMPRLPETPNTSLVGGIFSPEKADGSAP